MFYIIINGQKHYLSKKIVEKYGFKPGMRTPFTGYEIFEDDKNEEETTAGDQEIYKVPEDDYQENGEG